MKKTIRLKSIAGPSTLRSLKLCALASCLALVTLAAVARDDDDHKSDKYVQTNLVSDLPGIAQLQDTNLINAWGISFNSTSPFWISDNGSGLATLYAVTNDSNGFPHVTKEGLQVTLAGDGFPTGQLFNPTTAFHGDLFIFAGEDGFISGWRGALGTNAELLVTRTNAVYKGIVLDTNTGAPLLLLANFREATVDVYDTNLTLTQFSDPKAPAGYAPFNIQIIDGFIFVTFAKQNAVKHDDVAGEGHGLIDLFDLTTGKFHRFATGSDAGGHLKEFNSPWGMALAPEGFGAQEDKLLVGNFESGTIMVFDADGDFRDYLEDTHGKPIVIDGLWDLTFGNGGNAGVPGALYFSAGPNSESDGLFGSITPAPSVHKDHDHDHDGDHDGDRR